MQTNPVIRVRGLHKSFGSNHVLKDFSMELHRGENVAILGKSGSGKSVLIKCIINLLPPDSDTIEVLGQNMAELDSVSLDAMRARVGFLFQSNALYDSMTVRENLEFPLRRHWSQSQREQGAEHAVREALKDVGLEHTINMMPSELSGGMRKRVALARTLILKPEIILYDEPTTGLDPITSREISNLIVHVQKKYHTSSVIISHDLNCIDITANRVLMLIDGRSYAANTLDNLRNDPDPKIREFFE